MHHNRSLLPDVEVLSSAMVKTSRCSAKLLFVILKFCHNIFIREMKISHYKQHDFSSAFLFVSFSFDYNQRLYFWIWFFETYEHIQVNRHLIKYFRFLSFQMSPQNASFSGCKVTLVTFALFTPCVFKCCLKLIVLEVAYSHCLHLFGFSPLCIFKCILKLSSREDA